MKTAEPDKVSQIQKPVRRRGKPPKDVPKPLVEQALPPDKVSQIQKRDPHRTTKRRNSHNDTPTLFNRSGMPLTETHLDFILKRLAYFHTVSDIIKEFSAFFNEDILPQTVRVLDPYHIDPDDWAVENRARFDTYRKQAIASVHAIPIANQYARMAAAQDIFNRAMHDEDYSMARKILEYAAREEGGMYTNVRRLDANIKVENLTDEELQAKLVSFLGEGNLPEAVRPLIDYQGAKETEYEEIQD